MMDRTKHQEMNVWGAGQLYWPCHQSSCGPHFVTEEFCLIFCSQTFDFGFGPMTHDEQEQAKEHEGICE